MSKSDYLLSELQKNIEWFEGESKAHKTLYRNLRYAVFGLTGLSTAFASLAVAYPSYQSPINLVVIALTLSVGVVTSIEGLRKPAELWIHERTILYSLRDLKRDLEYRSAEGGELVSVDEVFAKMQSVLLSSREKWNQQIAGSHSKVAQDVTPTDRPVAARQVGG